MPNHEQEKLALERTKVEIDVVKHFTTLNTGSIVLTATLLGQFHKPVVAPNLIALSLGFLLVSLIACVWYLWTPWSRAERGQINDAGNRIAFPLTGSAFLIGILCLAVFSYQNLRS
jgi:hypothetical protein